MPGFTAELEWGADRETSPPGNLVFMASDSHGCSSSRSTESTMAFKRDPGCVCEWVGFITCRDPFAIL